MDGHSRALMKHRRQLLDPRTTTRRRWKGDLCLEAMTRGTRLPHIISTARCIKITGCFTPKSSSRWRLDKVSTHKDSSWPQKSMPKAPRDRCPEFFFHGIVGHVKDKSGGRINGWKEASRLANYWRRYFNIEEIPYSSHSTEPYEELTLHDMPRTSQKMRNNQTMRLMTRPPWGTWETQHLLSPCRSASWPISFTKH